MPIIIDVQLQAAGWKTILRPYCKTVRETCEAALKETLKKKRSKQPVEMTVVLADDAFIRKLNHDFRGKDKPTNVLSFPSDDAPFIGDIILALETTKREAEEQDKALRDHARHLLVHGTLHLLGFDHERDKDADVMEALEIKILKKLKVGNPYL